MTPCRATFDPAVHAAYLYVREFAPSEVARTEPWLHCEFHLDGDGQWLGFDVRPRAGLDLGDAACVRLGGAAVAHSFPWNQVNADIDAQERVLGFEVLFDRTMGMPARLGHLVKSGADPAC